jgi:hypothetical protein
MNYVFLLSLRAARGRVAALTCALTLGSASTALFAQTTAPALAAPAASPALQAVQAARSEIATPINAAQTLLGQGQLDEAMRNVALAAAVPKLTHYETMLVERTRAAIAQRQGNNALVVQALEAALATGQIPQADEVGLVEALVSIASRMNDHLRVLRWTERYAALGGTQDAVRMVRIQSQLASGDERGAMAALAARLDAADKAGQMPPESHLRTLLSLQQKFKDAGLQRTLERLVLAYPRPEYWMDLVVTVARDPAIPDRTLIELYRLLRVVGGVTQLALGQELAQLASRLGQPAEALSVIEDAYAAGQMGKGGQAAAHEALRDQVRKQAAAKAADRAAAEASAKTAPNGNGLVDLGWAMVAALPPGSPASHFEPGLLLMEQGLAKGGLRRPVEARLHLAMAQLAGGRKDAARQSLKALVSEAKTDPLAAPVQLWSLFAQAPAMLPTRQPSSAHAGAVGQQVETSLAPAGSTSRVAAPSNADWDRLVAAVEAERRKREVLEERLAAESRDRERLIAEARERDRAQTQPSAPPVIRNAHALVIGNAAYPGSGRLDNPVNDAMAISQKLRTMGFTVTTVTDANRQRLVQAMSQFRRTAASADVSLLFYSGHGVQVFGKNYMLPIDMDQTDVAQATIQGVSLNEVVENFLPGKTKLVFLDACRDNPLQRTGDRSVSRGLAPIAVAEGTLIAYATKDGQVASDGTGQRNSPFTQALLEHLSDPSDIAVVLRKVREKVMRATGGKQQPWEYGSLTGGELVLSAVRR